MELKKLSNKDPGETNQPTKKRMFCEMGMYWNMPAIWRFDQSFNMGMSSTKIHEALGRLL